MGLILRVQDYGFSPCIYLPYPDNRRVFFKGEMPRKGDLVTLNNIPKKDEISTKQWTKTRLDDFYVHESKIYSIESMDFSFEEIADFIEEAINNKKQNYSKSLRTKKIDELKNALDFEQKIRVVESSLPVIVRNFVDNEIEKSLYEKDRPLLTELKIFDVKKIPSILKKIKSRKGLDEATNIILDNFTDGNGLITKEGIKLFESVSKDDELYSRGFSFKDCNFTLPTNIKNREVNIIRSREVTVSPSLELFKANRIGSISRYRKALRVEEKGEIYFIEGDKRLKFKVIENGGRMKKSNNVIVVNFDEIRNLLIEIEKIDALACLNPGGILASLKENKVPKEIITVVESELSNDEYDYRKIANLSIHKLYGLDPELARKMYRQVK